MVSMNTAFVLYSFFTQLLLCAWLTMSINSVSKRQPSKILVQHIALGMMKIRSDKNLLLYSVCVGIYVLLLSLH